MKNKLLRLMTSISTITLIVGCNNNVGGSSAINPQKSDSVHSLTSGDSGKSDGSLVFMYKGAPIKQNRQLIFKTDDTNEIVTNVTTTNPDTNGKVYAIINTSPLYALDHNCNETSRIYQVDLTADNPISTKRQFDQFYFPCKVSNHNGGPDNSQSNIPVVSGFFGNGDGFVGEADSNYNGFHGGALHIYKNYQPIGYNTTFFNEQIRSITVTADDRSMFVATSHHLYQLSKGDVDTMALNFDTSPNNPFHEVASIRNFLQQKNEEIQAISFDSYNDGYIYTRTGNLYSVSNGNVINQDSPTHLFDTAESTAPYVTSINFENPIFNRVISKGNADDSIRQGWVNNNVSSDAFNNMHEMVKSNSGFLISLSCGASCNQKIDGALNNVSYDPSDMASFGLTKIIADIINGNLWSWDGFVGDTLLFMITAGGPDFLEDGVEAIMSNSAMKAEKAEIIANKEVQIIKQDQTADKISELTKQIEDMPMPPANSQGITSVDLIRIRKELEVVDHNLAFVSQFKEEIYDTPASSTMLREAGDYLNLRPREYPDGSLELASADFLKRFNNDYETYSEYIRNTNITVFRKTADSATNTYTAFDLQAGSKSWDELVQMTKDFRNGANIDPRYLNINRISSTENRFYQDAVANTQFLQGKRRYLMDKYQETQDIINARGKITELNQNIASLEEASNFYAATIKELDVQLEMLQAEMFAIDSQKMIGPLGLLGINSLNQFFSTSGTRTQYVSLPGQSTDDAKSDHGYITGSFLDLNKGILYSSESGGFDMLQDYTNQAVDNIGVSVAFDGKTQYTVVGYAPYGTAYRLYFQKNIYH